MLTLPEVTFSNLDKIFNKVDLPHPEGSNKATISFSYKSNDILFITSVSPLLEKNFFVISCIEINVFMYFHLIYFILRKK